MMNGLTHSLSQQMLHDRNGDDRYQQKLFSFQLHVSAHFDIAIGLQYD